MVASTLLMATGHGDLVSAIGAVFLAAVFLILHRAGRKTPAADPRT